MGGSAQSREDRRSSLLLKTNTEAGHGGASGRYHRYRETALQYAFLLEIAHSAAAAGSAADSAPDRPVRPAGLDADG